MDKRYLQTLECQFLCCFPVNNIDWQVIPGDLSWNDQHELLHKTCSHDLNRQYPVRTQYQLNFLKRLIQLLEQSSDEVHDEIYESYCQTQQTVLRDGYAYRHYLLPNLQTRFTLRESNSFVTEGTTGLCSWQASLALADYLLHHRSVVEQKNVLELGSGTGLCGFVAMRCGVRKIAVTDGSAECVNLMRENFLRNFPTARKEEIDGSFVVDASEGQIFRISQLSWDRIQEESKLLNDIDAELVLAADVVYDESVFEDLTRAIDFIFAKRGNQCELLLAATVRNEKTLQKFLQILIDLRFNVDDREVIPPAESYLHWDRSTPVHILSIKRNCKTS